MRTRTKKILILSAIILIAAAAVLVVIFSKQSGNKKNYEKQLIDAESYLEICDYDNAIALYNQIIAADETCAQAYAGLAQAYFIRSRTDKSLEILLKGAEKTGGDKVVMNKLAELFPDHVYGEADGMPDDTPEASAPAVTEPPVQEEETYSSVTAEALTEASDIQEQEVQTGSAETDISTEITTVPTTAATTAPTTAPATAQTTAPTTARTTAPTTARTTAPTTAATTRPTTAATTTKKRAAVTIPDFTNMSVDEAREWCSMNNIYLEIIGNESGVIISQSPAPNSSAEEDSSVIIKCR